MILSDGTDTREEVRRPGPYCDGMAVVLDRLSLEGDGTVYGGEDGGHFAVAFDDGRVLFCDSQGFKSSANLGDWYAADKAADAYAYGF